MKFFDTHAHYDWKEFDEDRQELFVKLKEVLCGLVNIGINIESIKKVERFAKENDFMFFSVGVHPLEVEKQIDLNKIEEIAFESKKQKDSKLVAIGETGLDYHFDISRDLQEKYFLKQIELANKLELPIVVHSRESHEDVLKILKNNPVKKGGIMHCYSGNFELAQKFVDLGFYLGIGGPVTKNKTVQEVVRKMPLEKLVVETDAPVLPPLPFEKTDRNDSLKLGIIVEKIAEIKNVSVEEVSKITTANAKKIYGMERK